MAYTHAQHSLSNRIFKVIECHRVEWDGTTIEQTMKVLEDVRRALGAQCKRKNKPNDKE